MLLMIKDPKKSEGWKLLYILLLIFPLVRELHSLFTVCLPVFAILSTSTYSYSDFIYFDCSRLNGSDYYNLHKCYPGKKVLHK